MVIRVFEPPGADGVQGAQGAQGVQGIQGIQGDQKPPGNMVILLDTI